MNNESKRDLHADLSLCAAATPGPYSVEYDGEGWRWWAVSDSVESWGGGVVVADCAEEADAHFIAAAREGWPHAIERAIEAEAEIERLDEEIADRELSHMRIYNENKEIRADLLHSSRTLYEAQRYIDELEAEIKRMREGLQYISKWYHSWDELSQVGEYADYLLNGSDDDE